MIMPALELGTLHCKFLPHENYGDWKLRGIVGPVIIMGFPQNSYSPFPKIVQIFPAGTPQFPVPVVFMG